MLYTQSLILDEKLWNGMTRHENAGTVAIKESPSLTLQMHPPNQMLIIIIVIIQKQFIEWSKPRSCTLYLKVPWYLVLDMLPFVE